MKIYSMVKIDINTGEKLEEDSYEYEGPMALAVGPCSSSSSYGPGSYNSSSDDLSSLPQSNPGGSSPDVFNNLYNSNPHDSNPGNSHSNDLSNLYNSNPNDSNPDDISSMHSLYSSSADNSNNATKTDPKADEKKDGDANTIAGGMKAEDEIGDVKIKGECKTTLKQGNDNNDDEKDINSDGKWKEETKATLRAEKGNAHVEAKGSHVSDSDGEESLKGEFEIGTKTKIGNDKASIKSASVGITKTEGEPETVEAKLEGDALGTNNKLKIQRNEEENSTTISSDTTYGALTMKGKTTNKPDGHESTIGMEVDGSKLTGNKKYEGWSVEASYSKDDNNDETYQGKVKKEINDRLSVEAEGQKNDEGSQVSLTIKGKF